MNPRIRQLGRYLFTAAAVVSLLLCVPAAGLALLSDHLHHKDVRIGQLEVFWHHDLVIISLGPLEFIGEAENQWSLDGSWIGLDGDIVNVDGQHRKWLYSLNVTQLGLLGLTSVLPGIWLFVFFWRKNKAEAEQSPI